MGLDVSCRWGPGVTNAITLRDVMRPHHTERFVSQKSSRASGRVLDLCLNKHLKGRTEFSSSFLLSASASNSDIEERRYI